MAKVPLSLNPDEAMEVRMSLMKRWNDINREGPRTDSDWQRMSRIERVVQMIDAAALEIEQ